MFALKPLVVDSDLVLLKEVVWVFDMLSEMLLEILSLIDFVIDALSLTPKFNWFFEKGTNWEYISS